MRSAVARDSGEVALGLNGQVDDSIGSALGCPIRARR
jgi:hypothetical protein